MGSISTLTFSIGSNSFPCESYFVKIYGGDTYISKPSLLIFSNKIAKCKSPLPIIVQAAPSEFFSSTTTLSATSYYPSLISLSLIYPEESFVPSFPPIGLLFTNMLTAIIGGSIGIAGITSVLPLSFNALIL